MAFTLHLKIGSQTFDRDDAGYDLNDAGVLIVTPGDGRRLTYSPSGWVGVEESVENPAPKAAARRPARVL